MKNHSSKYSPKLAWYYVNDKETHQKIQDSMYGLMDGAAMGQAVEDMVKKLYSDKTMAEVDTKQLKVEYEAKLNHLKKLKSSVLQSAFEGKLV